MKRNIMIFMISVFTVNIHAEENITGIHKRIEKVNEVIAQLPQSVPPSTHYSPQPIQPHMLPLRPIQIDLQMNPETDLVIGEGDPYEVVTITGDYFLDGNIIIINHGTLNLINASFMIRGDIYVADSAYFNIQGGHLTVLAEYLYQYIIMGLGNSTITFDSAEISINGQSWNAAFTDNSHIFIHDTQFNDGITASLWGNAEVDILRSNPFEWVIFDSATVNISHSGPHILWFGFPDSSQADISFPDGEFVTDFSISAEDDSVSGIGYTVSIDSTTDVWWGLILQDGSDVTVRDSNLRTTGIMAVEGDSLEISGLVNSQYYEDFSAPITDRNFHLINTSLETWNVYPWGVGKLYLNNSIIGEFGSFDSTEIWVENTLVDGSGGYVFTGGTSFTVFFSSSIFSHVISNEQSIQLHFFSSTLVGDITATGSSIMVFVNSITQQIPVARDTSVVLEMAVDSPENPTVNQFLPIKGTAIVSSGPFLPVDLLSYRLSYGIGEDPTEWIQIGSVHTEEVRNNVLGIWDTYGLETGDYNLKLTLHFSEVDSMETYRWVYLGESLEVQEIPAGNRILGLHVGETENNNYDSDFAYAQAACMQATGQFYMWSDLEPEPGQIGGPIFDLLDIVNYYYPLYGTRIELNIPVINTVRREVPSDLITEPFDSPLFINRFKTLLDSIFIKIPNVELIALNIGNEHGYFLAADPPQINEYKTFFDSVKVYAEMLYFNLHGQDLNVGTTLTFDALTDPSISGLMQDLNQSTDIVCVNYYGINPDFTAKNPLDVISDFSTLVNLYSDTTKPIYITECGYPSSSVCNSSETQQAAFIQNVFTVWDIYYDNIKYIGFVQTTDWSQEAVDALAVYYGLPENTLFKEYLRTLGLRTYPGNGTNKLAYNAMVLQADTRGFCDSTLVAIEISNDFPVDFVLSQNYPNPFNSETTIRYSLPHDAHISLVVFDLMGCQIRTLAVKNQPAGSYSIVWDGKDNSGRDIASGIYFYQLKAKGNNRMIQPTRKLLLLR